MNPDLNRNIEFEINNPDPFNVLLPKITMREKNLISRNPGVYTTH